MEKSIKLVAAPKLDANEAVFLEGGQKRENSTSGNMPTSSLFGFSTIHNSMAWMDSFPLLCGLPYCQEPTGSFVLSLAKLKGSDQFKSRNFDGTLFRSVKSFWERNQDHEIFCQKKDLSL